MISEEALDRMFKFIEALNEAVKKEQHTFTCPVCGGEVRWIRAKINGHINAVCSGQCGMRLYE